MSFGYLVQVVNSHWVFLLGPCVENIRGQTCGLDQKKSDFAAIEMGRIVILMCTYCVLCICIEV